jgi:hypothetical protein
VSQRARGGWIRRRESKISELRDELASVWLRGVERGFFRGWAGCAFVRNVCAHDTLAARSARAEATSGQLSSAEMAASAGCSTWLARGPPVFNEQPRQGRCRPKPVPERALLVRQRNRLEEVAFGRSRVTPCGMQLAPDPVKLRIVHPLTREPGRLLRLS